jgi:hypothetical protein
MAPVSAARPFDVRSTKIEDGRASLPGVADLQPPRERVCERCGRHDVWSDERGTWVAASDDERGNAHCVHAWDITGTYNPVVH